MGSKQASFHQNFFKTICLNSLNWKRNGIRTDFQKYENCPYLKVNYWKILMLDFKKPLTFKSTFSRTIVNQYRWLAIANFQKFYVLTRFFLWNKLVAVLKFHNNPKYFLSGSMDEIFISLSVCFVLTIFRQFSGLAIFRLILFENKIPIKVLMEKFWWMEQGQTIWCLLSWDFFFLADQKLVKTCF